MTGTTKVALAGARADKAREELRIRVRARRSELDQAVITRVFAVTDDSEPVDAEYTEGLRASVIDALDYGLLAIEPGEGRDPPVPPSLLTQTRLAARSGVNLDTILRRCFAGHTLLVDFMMQEAEATGLFERGELQSSLRAQATLVDRLLVAVSDEYASEVRERFRSSHQRRAEQVERLLAGEFVDTTDLAYELDAWHLAAIAKGPGVGEAMRELVGALDCRLLLVNRDEATVWAWLGSRQGIEPLELRRRVSSTWPSQLALAVGEPGQGLNGWRLTHRQASAALPVALRSPERFARYADVPLLASIFQDDLLATSLRDLFLAPLERERDGGKVARKTLCAYFKAGRNVSSTAAALGVSRRTVANRLRAIEETLGRPLGASAVEMEVALRLSELEDPQSMAPGVKFSI